MSQGVKTVKDSEYEYDDKEEVYCWLPDPTSILGFICWKGRLKYKYTNKSQSDALEDLSWPNSDAIPQ